MDPLKSIVVGMDFTECSRAAFAVAVRIAQWHQSDLTTVHVIDELVASELEEKLGGGAGFRDSIMADARREWERLAARVPGGERSKLEVMIGGRIQGILATAAGKKADLLVIGAYGDRAPDVGTGTVATACVRKAPCATLIVRGTQAAPYTRVLACVDFSDTSRRVLESAEAVATRDGAALDLLHVFPAPTNLFPFSESMRRSFEEAIGAIEKRARERLDSFCAPEGRALAYLKAERHTVGFGGNAGQAIADFAKDRGSDLIVLGTRGRTNLRDLLMGSTAERVLASTPCSVLAVRPVE